jgi:hypothetical protein
VQKGSGAGLIPVAGRRRWGKGVGGWILCKYCVHMYINEKNVSNWNYSMNEGGGDREEQLRGWSQVWYIWYLVGTFVNATM